VVTTGRVADLVDSSDTTVVHLDPAISTDSVAAVADRLREVAGIQDVEVVADEGDSRLVVTAGMPRPDVVRALAAVGADVVGLSSRKHLEEVFLRVIANAQTSGEPTESVTERLRQVRAR
jgi:ABC-2 type transport system ATP-binding protein